MSEINSLIYNRSMDNYFCDGVTPTINGFSEYHANGGPGSGNFGHLGRPGKVGGSGSTGGKSSGSEQEEFSPDITRHIANTAQTSIDKAQKEESEVSRDLDRIFKKNGANFAGFEFRVKTKSSLADKIARDLKDDGLEPTNDNIQRKAQAIHDNLRYTALSSKDNLTSHYDGIVKDLEASGYEVIRVKNSFPKKNVPYRGLNTLVKNKNGYIFELQFHTPQSLEIKEKNHIDYNIARDPKTSKSKKRKLEEIMVERADTIETPVRVEQIKNMDMLKKS